MSDQRRGKEAGRIVLLTQLQASDKMVVVKSEMVGAAGLVFTCPALLQPPQPAQPWVQATRGFPRRRGTGRRVQYAPISSSDIIIQSCLLKQSHTIKYQTLGRIPNPITSLTGVLAASKSCPFTHRVLVVGRCDSCDSCDRRRNETLQAFMSSGIAAGHVMKSTYLVSPLYDPQIVESLLESRPAGQ